MCLIFIYLLQSQSKREEPKTEGLRVLFCAVIQATTFSRLANSIESGSSSFRVLYSCMLSIAHFTYRQPRCDPSSTTFLARIDLVLGFAYAFCAGLAFLYEDFVQAIKISIQWRRSTQCRCNR